MSESTGLGDVQARPPSRLVIRYMLDYARRTVDLVDQDLMVAVTFLAVLWANVKASTLPQPGESAAEVQRMMDQRTPTSVYAISRNLKIPYESARRYVNKLAEHGLCDRVDGGYATAASSFPSQGMEIFVDQAWEATLGYLDDLARNGVGFPAGAAGPAHDLRRRVARLSIDYFLRGGLGATSQCLQLTPLTGFIFLTIADINYEPLFQDGDLRETALRAHSLVPDDYKQPATVYQVAKRMRVPYETVRRHVTRLLEDNWCDRLDDGRLVVPGRVMVSPPVTKAVHRSWAVTRDFVHALKDLGVELPEVREARHTLLH